MENLSNLIQSSYDAIDTNVQLSAQLKENFKYLLTTFNSTFGDVDLTNFNERIKSLKVKEGNKFLNNQSIVYNVRDNVISVMHDKTGCVDFQFEEMKVLLEMISAKENDFGIASNGKNVCLNTGILEMLANNLVQNANENPDLQAQAITNLIFASSKVTIEQATKAFFANDSDNLLKVILSGCNSDNVQNLKVALETADYEVTSLKNGELNSKKVSTFGIIQKAIVQALVNSENKDEVLPYIISNKEVVGITSSCDCPHLQDARQLVDRIEKNNELVTQVVKGL